MDKVLNLQKDNVGINVTREKAKIIAEREKRLAKALRDNLKRRKNSKVVLPQQK
tara:strand:- start:374 stop:535 length:162 start_codon:yes stop_codon:yes gene_type:complete